MAQSGHDFDEVLSQAKRLRNEGESMEALLLLTRSGEPASLGVETLRAALEMDVGFFDTAEQRYRQVIEHADEIGDRRSSVYARTGLAAVLRRTGQLDEAHDLLKATRRLAPGNREVAATQVAVLRDMSRSEGGSPGLDAFSASLAGEFGLDQHA